MNLMRGYASLPPGPVNRAVQHFRAFRLTPGVSPAFLPPANEVCEGYVFTGVCLSTPGVCACFGGHVWFYSGGHVWLYSGGAWFYSGHAWFCLGVMHGFPGGCTWFFRGGACVVFSVFSDTMRYSQ